MLTGQYLRNRKIAKEFAVYYDLFNKYQSDYGVDKILSGKAPEETKGRAAAAKFDERPALLGLILDAVTEEMKNFIKPLSADKMQPFSLSKGKTF